MTAKRWDQPECPSVDEWISKMLYISYNGILLSHKKNKIMPFAATWIDPEMIILSEVSQKEKPQVSRCPICYWRSVEK